MRFYSKQHKYYCGVDIHAKTMYVCIIDQEARIIKQKNIKSNPAAFMKAIDKYREDIVVSAECMFTWYWLADLCGKENITFILGAKSGLIEQQIRFCPNGFFFNNLLAV
jgi:hypothetical protein